MEFGSLRGNLYGCCATLNEPPRLRLRLRLPRLDQGGELHTPRQHSCSNNLLFRTDLVIDRPTRRVRVRDTAVFLSAKEFELVAKLASEPYRVFTKEELLREVWGYRALGRTRTLESHASRVRKKLCLDPDDRFIVNVWGVGYRMLD